MATVNINKIKHEFILKKCQNNHEDLNDSIIMAVGIIVISTVNYDHRTNVIQKLLTFVIFDLFKSWYLFSRTNSNSPAMH